MSIGFLFTGLLWWLRTRFPMFPFHPTGYAVASSTLTFGWLWFSVFMSWGHQTPHLAVRWYPSVPSSVTALFWD